MLRVSDVVVVVTAAVVALMACLGAAAPITLPVTGSIGGPGEFFVEAYLGTPPQLTRTQFDTGSTDLLVYSDLCGDECPHTLRYKANLSSTSSPVNCSAYDCSSTCDKATDRCKFEDMYADGTGAVGLVTQDVFSIGGGINATVSFGEITRAKPVHGWEGKGSDGIWGLAYPRISAWGAPSAVELLSDANPGFADAFSICVGGDDPSITFGFEYNASQYTVAPIIHDIWYVVNMTDMLVEGVSVGVPPITYNKGGAIVDSGTTLMYVPKAAFSGLETIFTRQCSFPPGLTGVCGVPEKQSILRGERCYNMTAADLAAFPNVTVVLDGGSQLPIGPADYLYTADGYGEDCYFFGIFPEPESDGTILGDIFMQAFNVVFDRTANVLAFGPPSSCPATGASRG